MIFGEIMKRILPYLLILLTTACFPFKSSRNQAQYSNQGQARYPNSGAVVTGTWNGSSVDKDHSQEIATRFVLAQQGDKISGEFYLQNASGGLVKYGDVQGVIQQGAWGKPLQATMVIYYPNGSYTNYTGTFIGDVFQGQYQYLDKSNIVQTFGQTELFLVR